MKRDIEYVRHVAYSLITNKIAINTKREAVSEKKKYFSRNTRNNILENTYVVKDDFPEIDVRALNNYKAP